MEIKNFILGEIETNVYLVFDIVSKKAWLIETATSKLDEVYEFIEKNNLDLQGVIYTHGHYDHIMGIEEIQKYKKNIKIAIGLNEYEYLQKPEMNLSRFLGRKISISEDVEIVKLKEGDEIGFFRVIFTPGHTKGGISLFIEDEGKLFVGDTIFNESFGRTDLPGGDYSVLEKSIEKILCLDENIVMYPGHGESVSIAKYKKWWKNYKYRF